MKLMNLDYLGLKIVSGFIGLLKAIWVSFESYITSLLKCDPYLQLKNEGVIQCDTI